MAGSAESRKNRKDKKLGNLNQKLLKVLKFLILFNIFAIPLYLSMFFGLNIYSFQKITAEIVVFLLNIIGMPAILENLTIVITTANGIFSGIIDWDCTGWKSVLAFFALVFATEEPLRKKVFGLALIPMIFIANLFRILMVFVLINTFGTEIFPLVHSFFFGFFMIMVILGLWIFWIKWFKFSEFSNAKGNS